MDRRILVVIASVLVTWTQSALAAPRDAAAEKKIDEAINVHYLATEFDKAEGLLVGTLNACEEKCSPAVKARAWMYVGVVRGSGKGDIAGAQQAFGEALALDPAVKLDDALSTPPVREAFVGAGGAGAAGDTGGAGGGGDKGGAPLANNVPGGMECTPSITEIETNRPLPVSCKTEEPAATVVLRYKAFGSSDFETTTMRKVGSFWQGTIACKNTKDPGRLRWFVQAKDRAGDVVDYYGDRKTPAEIKIVTSSEEDPPAFPGKDPPQRCSGAGGADCPPGMEGTPACAGSGGDKAGSRGSGMIGDPCPSGHRDCGPGLLCLVDGSGASSCDVAPGCTTASECPAGAVCTAGVCDIGGDDAAFGPAKQNWVGLHFAPDVAFLPGGKAVCDSIYTNNSQYRCFTTENTQTDPAYKTGDQFIHLLQKNHAGNLNGGASIATMRLLASYERIIVSNFGVELRAGFAFNGGPSSGGGSFLPVHLEVRGKYTIGRGALSRPGLRPYVFLGGGMAQVDAKLPVTAGACTESGSNRLMSSVESYGQDPRWNSALRCYDPNSTGLDNPNAPYALTQVKLDAYRRMGNGFVSGGFGAMYAIEANHGVVLNLNAMFFFPSTGLVLEPSLGYIFGF